MILFYPYLCFHAAQRPSNHHHSIATIIQAEIYNGTGSSSDRQQLFPEFNVLPDLPYEQGGVVDPANIPPDVINRECRDDTSLRHMILEKRVPTIESIYLFMENLKYRACYPEECDIIALVYVNRLMRGNESQARVPVTAMVRSPFVHSSFRICKLHCAA